MFGRSRLFWQRTHESRAGVALTQRALVSLTVGLTLCGACSILVDTTEKQCLADLDCERRGFVGSVCLGQLCQPKPMSSNRPPASGTPQAGQGSTSSDMRGIDKEPVATGGSSTGTTPARVETARPGGAGSSGMTAASATAGVGGTAIIASSAGKAGMPMTPVMTMTPCTGAGCPECSVDADCEQRGLAGGICADSICWPAPTAPQCSADKDCASLGPEYVDGRCVETQCRPNPRWRCEVPAPPPPTGTTTLKVLVRDSLSLGAVTDARIVACPKLDLMCTAPVAEGRTDKDGYLTLEVAAKNFSGYLQQTDRREYAPAMYFLPSPLPPAGKVLQPFPLLGAGTLIDTLAIALGATIDETRGNLMLIAEDCLGMALAGVAFSSPQADMKTVQFYVRDLLPSPTAKETAEIGNGGYLNFPPGTAVINVQQVKTKLHLSTVSIVVRPGFISVAYIRPEPRREIIP